MPDAEACVSGRNPQQWPFSIDSPFNIPISNSATYLASNGSNQTFNLALKSEFCNINYSSNSIAIYYAKNTDPIWDVLVHWDWSTYVAGVTAPADFHVPMHIPSGAVPTGGESTMIVMDPDGIHWHEMWNLFNIVNNTSLQTSFYKNNDGTFNGLATGTANSQAVGPRAYHGSVAAGLIRAFDITQGAIKHALLMAADGSQLFTNPGGTLGACTGFVWPAFGQDWTSCTTDLYTGLNPIGTLTAIPPSVKLTSVASNDLGINDAGALMMARAAQDYGVYACMDRTGSAGAGTGFHTFYSEWPGVSSTWISNATQNFNMDRIRHALQVVTNNGSTTPGGGTYNGTATGRRAALAPGF